MLPLQSLTHFGVKQTVSMFFLLRATVRLIMYKTETKNQPKQG